MLTSMGKKLKYLQFHAENVCLSKLMVTMVTDPVGRYSLGVAHRYLTIYTVDPIMCKIYHQVTKQPH